MLEVEPAFKPVILQHVSKETKALDSSGSNVISFYADYMDPQNKGIIFQVWLDPAVDQFEFFLRLDYFGSLSMLVVTYRTLLITLCFCVLLAILPRVLARKGV